MKTFFQRWPNVHPGTLWRSFVWNSRRRDFCDCRRWRTDSQICNTVMRKISKLWRWFYGNVGAGDNLYQEMMSRLPFQSKQKRFFFLLNKNEFQVQHCWLCWGTPSTSWEQKGSRLCCSSCNGGIQINPLESSLTGCQITICIDLNDLNRRHSLLWEESLGTMEKTYSPLWWPSFTVQW